MNNKINSLYVLTFFVIVFIGFGSCEQMTLGTFKAGDCVALTQICSNCTYVNITNILSPNSTVLLTDKTMNKVGTQYDYTFCDTNSSGQYIVNGVADLDGVTTIWNYNFFITPNGDYNFQGTPFAVIIVVLIVVSVFFLILGLKLEFPGAKVFFIFMAGVCLLFAVGLCINLAQSYFPFFTNLSAIMNAFWILIIILTAGGLIIGVIAVLLYAFESFQFKRGKRD